jgi:hypothetical protein
MRSRLPVFITLLFAALAATPARAQSPAGRAEDRSDVRIVSSFVAPGEPVPVPCREEAQVFARNLVQYPRPLAWHWVLLCDEAGWHRFLRLTARAEGEPIYASTDLIARTTYLRGFKLLYPYDLQAEPAAILAHELAHIQLDSPEEEDAKEQARRWRSGRQGRTRYESSPALRK